MKVISSEQESTRALGACMSLVETSVKYSIVPNNVGHRS